MSGVRWWPGRERWERWWTAGGRWERWWAGGREVGELVARQGVGQVVARQVGVRDVGQVRVDGKGGGQAGSGARWWPGEMVARRDGGEMVARWWSG